MTQHITFWKIISILLIINLIGCTSLQTIEAPPEKLHEQIRHENLVKVGDKVRIITEDQKEHQFIVTAIYEDEIRGEDVTIPIDSIVTLETREFSTGKTVLLGAGITGTVLLILAAILLAVAGPVTM
ncbi:MAG: hypothetical protein WCH04_20480 [Gammaproteobacteria bacterium]